MPGCLCLVSIGADRGAKAIRGSRANALFRCHLVEVFVCSRSSTRGRHDAEIEAFLLAMEQASGDERLHELFVDAGVDVAVELVFRDAVAELVAKRTVRNFGADVETFVEAEVAAVAVAVVGAFETLHAAEDHDFLPLGPAELHMWHDSSSPGPMQKTLLGVAVGAIAAGFAWAQGQSQPGSQPPPQHGRRNQSGRAAAVAFFAVRL